MSWSVRRPETTREPLIPKSCQRLEALQWGSKETKHPAVILSPAVNAIKSAYQTAPRSRIWTGRAQGNLPPTHPTLPLIPSRRDQSPDYTRKMWKCTPFLRRKASSGIIVECSHSNSRKKNTKGRSGFCVSIIDQVRSGEKSIRVFMLEINLLSGCQKIPDDLANLKYGVSVTDACIGWDETQRILVHACELLRKARLEGGSVQPL